MSGTVVKLGMRGVFLFKQISSRQPRGSLVFELI